MSPPGRPVLLVLALHLLTASTSLAQVSEQRVRVAIDDAARGLGQAIAGGSPLIGPSPTTGGLGHFAVGAGSVITLAEIEDPTRAEGTVDFALPTATVHAALGLARGTDPARGLGGFGAIDVLARFGTVMAREDIEQNAALWSLGARVGILREGALFPAITVSALGTWIDGLDWDPGSDDPTFRADVRSLSLRAEVSKRLLTVTPYAGVGLDRTSIDAAYTIPAGASTGGTEIRGSLDVSSAHPKAYAGLGLGFLLLDAALELGAYDGGAFGAVGVRIAH